MRRNRKAPPEPPKSGNKKATKRSIGRQSQAQIAKDIERLYPGLDPSLATANQIRQSKRVPTVQHNTITIGDNDNEDEDVTLSHTSHNPQMNAEDYHESNCNSLFGRGKTSVGLTENRIKVGTRLANAINVDYNQQHKLVQSSRGRAPTGKGVKMELSGKQALDRLKTLLEKYTAAWKWGTQTRGGNTDEDIARGIETVSNKQNDLCPCYNHVHAIFKAKQNIKPHHKFNSTKPSTNSTVDDNDDVSETSEENHGDDSEYNLQENSDVQSNSLSLEDHQVHLDQNPNSLVANYCSNHLDKVKIIQDCKNPLLKIAATNASEQAALMAKIAADQHEYNMKKLALKQDKLKHGAAELAWQFLDIERQTMAQDLMASYRESKGVVNNSNIEEIEQTVIAAFGEPICFVRLGLPQTLTCSSSISSQSHQIQSPLISLFLYCTKFIYHNDLLSFGKQGK
ncbi:hypothetical protein DFH28DRAFT_928528 [Melampsora americana]|nr:hypothetical protein DFH28DRAFT_928528 [Melampsora americana]